MHALIFKTDSLWVEQNFRGSEALWAKLRDSQIEDFITILTFPVLTLMVFPSGNT